MKYFEVDINNVYSVAFPAKRTPTPGEALEYLRKHDTHAAPGFLDSVTPQNICYFGEVSKAEALNAWDGTEEFSPFE